LFAEILLSVGAPSYTSMDGVKEMAPQIESSHQPVDEAVAVNTTDSSSVPNSSSEATAGASTNGIEQDSGNTAETSKGSQVKSTGVRSES
jgi:hypothetical protein